MVANFFCVNGRIFELENVRLTDQYMKSCDLAIRGMDALSAIQLWTGQKGEKLAGKTNLNSLLLLRFYKDEYHVADNPKKHPYLPGIESQP